ncbi:MAG: hypothetical protein CL798_02950 [Chromatiales bacterium]|nr:hypothetical protein [Chromatiales bacterium]
MATAAFRTANYAKLKAYFKDAKWVDEVAAIGRAGLELVSITFTVGATRVQWPTIKTPEAKRAAAEAMIKRHGDSHFTDSWATLPADLQEYILTFGQEPGKRASPPSTRRTPPAAGGAPDFAVAQVALA